MTTLVIPLPNLAATHRLGELLGRSLPVGSILLLQGNLGSGKTSLVQGIGHALGITDPIVSPTFTLISEYFEGSHPLYHLDLYRLSSTEIAPLYLETYWDGDEFPPGIVAIEWAERLPHSPESYLAIEMIIEGDRRQARFNLVGSPPITLATLKQSLASLLPQSGIEDPK